MSDGTGGSKYRLPLIGRVHLAAFDLYRRKPDIQVTVDQAVFCLMGANGLGKSTFLSTLLYGLTGGLPHRVRKFSSPQEYREEATRLDRRDDYYGGRLSEAVAEHAAIAVELRWPDKTAEVTRRLLGPGAVTRLSVNTNDDEAPSRLEGAAAERAYETLVVQESGLPSFDQFLFLMHYVCTFDEDRHLLLWDPVALTNALYLAFGSDSTQAAEANHLKREVERFGSRARNSRFAARQSLDRAEQLRKALEDDDGDTQPNEATRQRYNRLNERLDDAVARAHRKDAELRRSEATVSDRSAALAGLQLEYDRTFAARADASLTASHHPLVRSTLRHDRCAVCATTGVAENLLSSIEARLCPLCGSGVSHAATDQANIEKLKLLDRRIEESRATLDEALRRRERLQDDHATAIQAEIAARETREAFLAANPEADRQADPGNDPTVLSAAIEREEDQARSFDSKSKKEYRQRDKARRALLKIERELQARFDDYSERFAALFRSYAQEFLGLTVDIQLEHRKGLNETGFELLLTMEDQIRSRAEDVSESQRFFLDIALRMALAQFVSSTSATLLIDTPEGSLDITYEARAGQMFSKFATGGNAILMTANLRSSALLQRLAEMQKRDGMQIERMTDWTELSEVQLAEERLFAETYEEIERALA